MVSRNMTSHIFAIVALEIPTRTDSIFNITNPSALYGAGGFKHCIEQLKTRYLRIAEKIMSLNSDKLGLSQDVLLALLKKTDFML